MHQTQKATSEDVALIALAGSTGLEPATSDVTGRRSNQTELTPQADVRVCFRSRALRGLVYTEVCPARNNFFEKFFGAIREGSQGLLRQNYGNPAGALSWGAPPVQLGGNWDRFDRFTG